MASGTTTLDFGAWPGTSRAETSVSGQTGLVSTTRIEAYVQPIATADHSADEHRSADLRVMGYYSADGTLKIEGYNDSPQSIKDNNSNYRKQRLYGLYTVGWAWSNT